MRITQVEAVPFCIPYGKRLSWATGSADGADHVLVILRTSEGITGCAEAIPRPTIYGESQASIVHAINTWFAPLLMGAHPFSAGAIEREMNKIYGNFTAKAAINMALFDIQAKSCGQPLYRYLGGEYPDGGLKLTWMVHLDEPSRMVAQVQEKFAEGYRCFKLKGGIDPAGDVRLVQMIREAVGAEAELYVDANQGYTVTDAGQILDQLFELGVRIVEEPLPVRQINRRQLQQKFARRSNICVLGDDSVYTPADVLRELEQGTIDMVSLKPARSGVSDSRKIVAIADLYGAPVLIGTQGESAIGTLHAAHIAAGLNVLKHPAELAFFTVLHEQLVTELPQVRQGKLHIPRHLPGSGIEIDDRQLSRFRVDR